MEIEPLPLSWANVRRQASRHGFAVTSFRFLAAWARENSISVMPLDLGCCAPSWTGEAVFSTLQAGIDETSDPRHADVLMVSGALSSKAVPVLRRIYDQMPEPKSVVAVGSCALGGGLFGRSYAVVPSVADILPVDVFIPGCPPSFASFRDGIERLRRRLAEKTMEG